MATGRVIKVQVLAEFKCDRCEGTCRRLASATVGGFGFVPVMSDPYEGEVVCNECFDKQRAEETRRAKEARARKNWKPKVTR